jgi:hypothetical protein
MENKELPVVKKLIYSLGLAASVVAFLDMSELLNIAFDKENIRIFQVGKVLSGIFTLILFLALSGTTNKLIKINGVILSFAVSGILWLTLLNGGYHSVIFRPAVCFTLTTIAMFFLEPKKTEKREK